MLAMPSKKQKFTVILDPEEKSGYSVYCPALPGCVSQGEDRDSALENIKDAIRLMLEVLTEDRKAVHIPSSGSGFTEKESPSMITDEVRRVLDQRRENGLPLTIETTEVEVVVTVPA